MHCVPVPSDLIGPIDAAEILHVTDKTVRQMVKRGELTGYRVTSGLTKVSESEVRAHIKATAPASTELDAHIRRIVDAAPALTPEQLERLRALLASPKAA
ncbi:helix-turn-helix domain-containing protein [Streptomyces sp. NPDC047009]|uniref:helix-turn-helix domain-containing protein n=1 Tax=Streptomyces sp. NPDC047009 TaxID=3154496 RepID=UPI0033DA600B